MARLNDSPQIWRLAADLKVRHQGKPRDAILEMCRRKVTGWRKELGSLSLSAFLDEVALRLRTRFIELRSDSDVESSIREYEQRQEFAIAAFLRGLDSRDYGVTFRLQAPRHWELPFISFIDCRGPKAPAAYFTKWHELAHLLTLTDQTRLSFQRTHVSGQPKDAEESLMDVIAGDLAFPTASINASSLPSLTFEAAETLRLDVCPDSSRQAWLIGLSRSWTRPVAFLTAQPRYKKSEQAARQQHSFDFRSDVVPSLRLASLNINDAGREAGLQLFAGWRIPERSVIFQAFQSGTTLGPADENLDWWTTSTGSALPAREVTVRAMGRGNVVYAFVTPRD